MRREFDRIVFDKNQSSDCAPGETNMSRIWRAPDNFSVPELLSSIHPEIILQQPLPENIGAKNIDKASHDTVDTIYQMKLHPHSGRRASSVRRLVDRSLYKRFCYLFGSKKWGAIAPHFCVYGQFN